jgi:hypothetical protein
MPADRIASFSCYREELCRSRKIVGREMAAGHWRRIPMHGLIYLVGLIVVILAVLSFFGLR